MNTTSFQSPWIRDDSRALSVARYSPRWWGAGRRFFQLAPPADLIRQIKSGEIGFIEFRREYQRRVLWQLDAREFYFSRPNAILVCHCQNPLQCHRRIIADWIETHTGRTIKEI